MALSFKCQFSGHKDSLGNPVQGFAFVCRFMVVHADEALREEGEVEFSSGSRFSSKLQKALKGLRDYEIE